MRRCYHESCDRLGHPDLSEDDFDFLERITQALAYTVAKVASDGKTGCPLVEDQGEEEAPLPDKLFVMPEGDYFVEDEKQEEEEAAQEVHHDYAEEEDVQDEVEEDDVHEAGFFYKFAC